MIELIKDLSLHWAKFLNLVNFLVNLFRLFKFKIRNKLLLHIKKLDGLCKLVRKYQTFKRYGDHVLGLQPTIRDDLDEVLRR